eukprot:TRINITY_DN3944_c0_g1_i1.p1 TRINITY_DN3944_c0_g1~~TRINITY_DN3944_c0_g1_i1.p1  ORF type:complete len:430 (+),score=106.40 TRINITY_DN3944_c0_g1_i1:155-1444(+)
MKPSKTVSVIPSLCWKLSQRNFISTHTHYLNNTRTLLSKIPSSHFSTNTNNRDNETPTNTTGSGKFNIPQKTSRWSLGFERKQEAPKDPKEDMSFNIDDLLIREQGNTIDTYEESAEREPPKTKSSVEKGDKATKDKPSKPKKRIPKGEPSEPSELTKLEKDYAYSEEFLSRFERKSIDRDSPEKTSQEIKEDISDANFQNGSGDLHSLSKEISTKKSLRIGTIEGLANYPHYGLWPKKIREWVGWAKLPKGLYNWSGYYDAFREDHFQDLADRQKKRKHFDKYFVFTPKTEDKPLPPDLEGHYRFGIQPDELKGIHPKLIDFLSFKNAKIGEIKAFRKQQAIKKYQKAPNDTGAMAAQIACLTVRINALSEHLQKHKQDVSSKRGLAALITRRYQYLKYLKKHDPAPYYEVLREYNLRDVPVQFWRNK